jgi:hypothetical protein
MLDINLFRSDLPAVAAGLEKRGVPKWGQTRLFDLGAKKSEK